MFEVSNKILCVDDQPEITRLLEQQLSQRYQVSFANSATEALKLMAGNGPFAVMLVDYAMPGMDGVELLREVRQRAPDTVSIMLTAFADVSVAVSALHDANIFRFVRKPWDAAQLRAFIDDALERYRTTVSERSLASSLEKVNRRLFERLQELESGQKAMNRRLALTPTIVYEAVQDDRGIRLGYLSQNIESLTGHSVSSCLADKDPWSVVIHESDRAQAIERMIAAPIDANLIRHGEYRLQCRNGRFIRVHDAFRKIASDTGAVEIVGSWTSLDTPPG